MAASVLVPVLAAVADGAVVVGAGEPPIARYPSARLGGRWWTARSVVLALVGVRFAGAASVVAGSAPGSLVGAMLVDTDLAVRAVERETT